MGNAIIVARKVTSPVPRCDGPIKDVMGQLNLEDVVLSPEKESYVVRNVW